MSVTLWEKCLDCLQDEFPSQQFNTWIRPLQAEQGDNKLVLLAPNRFVLDWIMEKFLSRIIEIVTQLCEPDSPPVVSLEIGSTRTDPPKIEFASRPQQVHSTARSKPAQANEVPNHRSNVNPNYTFDNFVEGKSNQLAKAASLQVGENPAVAYNPLYLYGGVGLGKTHLLHAIGNQIMRNNPNAKVLYLHSGTLCC